jgi:hypothetical protein
MQDFRADKYRVRQHCAQCLTDLYANGRQTPAGEMLCGSCYSALWGPKVADEFRGMVALHMGQPMSGRLAPEVTP